MGDRKYFYFEDQFPTVSFWGRFSGRSVFPFCVYYEDGRYYEFFTGKELVFGYTFVAGQ